MASPSRRSGDTGSQPSTAGKFNDGDAPAAGRLRQLHDIAARRFFERGYSATSVQEIADEIGLLKGSLYHYISSKEELLYEIVSQVHGEFEEELQRCRRLPSEPLECLREYVRSYTLYVLSNAVEVGVFYQDAQHLRSDHYEHILKMRDQREQFLVDLLVEGQRVGQVRVGLNPKLAALALFGSMNWTYRWYHSGGAFDAAAIADHFAEQAVASVAEPLGTTPAD